MIEAAVIWRENIAGLSRRGFSPAEAEALSPRRAVNASPTCSGYTPSPTRARGSCCGRDLFERAWGSSRTAPFARGAGLCCVPKQYLETLTGQKRRESGAENVFCYGSMVCRALPVTVALFAACVYFHLKGPSALFTQEALPLIFGALYSCCYLRRGAWGHLPEFCGFYGRVMGV